MKHAKVKGFTLIELLVTMSIVVIISLVAGPSFVGYMNEMKSRQQANLFLAALNLVRSEAITRVTRVTICKAETTTTCSAADDVSWNNYWLIFTDAGDGINTGTIGVIDSNETIIKLYKGLGDGIAIAGGEQVRNYVSFVGSGIPKLADGSEVDELKTHFTICGKNASNDYDIAAFNSRVVSVSKTGRLDVTKYGYYPEVDECY